MFNLWNAKYYYKMLRNVDAFFTKYYRKQKQKQGNVNKSGKLSQDMPVLPQVVKLGHASMKNNKGH